MKRYEVPLPKHKSSTQLLNRRGINMKPLSDKNFREQYIAYKCRQILGVDAHKPSIKFIDVGALNFVYKVKTKKGNIFFKQALKRAKKYGQIGADLASVSYSRIEIERRFISRLQGRLPKEIRLPKVLSYDKKNNILMMTDVAKGNGLLLQTALLRGDFNEKTASNIGRFLGITHRITFNKNNTMRGTREKDLNNWKLFLNMRTRGIKSGQIGQKVADELNRLYSDAIRNHTYNVLVNIDCCPKNISQMRDHSIGVFDFELASGVGDPAYDIGFALGHYFLLSVVKDVPQTSIASINSLVNSYMAETRGLKLEGLAERMIKYAGAIPLYRMMGSSPASYIPKEKYGELIAKGSEIITSNCTKISEAVKILSKR